METVITIVQPIRLMSWREREGRFQPGVYNSGPVGGYRLAVSLYLST